VSLIRIFRLNFYVMVCMFLGHVQCRCWVPPDFHSTGKACQGSIDIFCHFSICVHEHDPIIFSHEKVAVDGLFGLDIGFVDHFNTQLVITHN
jgi:hypothetical protein